MKKLSILLMAAILLICLIGAAGCDLSLNGDPTCTHTHVEKETVAPTCDTEGFTIFECTLCGHKKKENSVAPYGHTNVFTGTFAPTCEEEGYDLYTCSVCAKTQKENVIPALGHAYESIVTEPGCTTQGYTTYNCTVCGYQRTDDYVKASGHAYTSVIIQPTCTAQGYTTLTCDVCNSQSVVNYTAVTPHSYTSVVTPPTCTEQGYTTSTCKDCGHVRVDSVTSTIPHSYTLVITPPTCTTQGYTTYTCKDCGAVKVDNYTTTAHNYSAVVTQATCTEQGYTTYTCKDCGFTEVGNYTSTSPHQYEKLVVDPTGCTSGYDHFVCRDCKTDYKTNYTSPTGGGHDFADGKCIHCEKGYKDIAVDVYDVSKNLDGRLICYVVPYMVDYYELYFVGKGDMRDFSSDLINGSPIYIDGYAGKVKRVTFDGEITSIGKYAFYDCYNLESVTISDGVTIIDDYSFYFCTGLTSVTIPDSVASIGNYAFYNCHNLKNVTIPSGVRFIGGSAFGYCSSLTGITIPNGVTDIGDYLFSYCENLTSVIISNGVTSISVGAFKGCASLANIKIPDSVTSIGGDAFKGTAIYNDDSNWDNKVLYIDNCLIEAKSTISGSYTIKEGTRFISEYVFESCAMLTSVIIPGSVSSIDDLAFHGCSSLTSITISEGVKSIGVGAFKICSSLKSITIPGSVTSIGADAFYGCSSLTSITIPEGITSIGPLTFYDCVSLASVTIPEGVKSIAVGAFENCIGLNSITIPASVTVISDYAFNGCIGLKSVYYKGGKSDWEKVGIYSNNDYLSFATVYYYSETKPAEDINYWYYDQSDNIVAIINEKYHAFAGAEVQDKEGTAFLVISYEYAKYSENEIKALNWLFDLQANASINGGDWTRHLADVKPIVTVNATNFTLAWDISALPPKAYTMHLGVGTEGSAPDYKPAEAFSLDTVIGGKSYNVRCVPGSVDGKDFWGNVGLTIKDLNAPEVMLTSVELIKDGYRVYYVVNGTYKNLTAEQVAAMYIDLEIDGTDYAKGRLTVTGENGVFQIKVDVTNFAAGQYWPHFFDYAGNKTDVKVEASQTVTVGGKTYTFEMSWSMPTLTITGAY